MGGGWRQPTWLLAGQAQREARGHFFSEVAGGKKTRQWTLGLSCGVDCDRPTIFITVGRRVR